MILARLLSPDDFGLLAMATVFVNFAMIFSEMGISSALIQKQDTHDRHYYSAFWFNIVVGLCLTLFFIAVSPLIARFYKKPELVPILAVISLNFFFSSFVIIQQTILTKEMDFRKLAIRDIIAVIISGIVGVVLAYNGFGVWSLVFQSVIFTLANAVLLWTVSSWRPKFSFAMADIKDIFHFSANLTGFNIVNYFARNIDQLLIGKFLGAQALGYYSLAYKIMLYPLQNVSQVIVKVMFPAFARMQGELEKVRIAYMRMIKAISLIVFPLMCSLFAIAPDFVHFVFGIRWTPIIILIQILSLCGLVQSISTTGGSIMLSQGRADMQLKFGALGSFFVFIAVLLGIKWQLVGVAVFYTLEQIIWTIYVQYSITNKLIVLPIKRFNSNLGISLLFGIFTIIFISFFRFLLPFDRFVNFMIIILILPVFYLFLLLKYKELSFRENRFYISLLGN